MTSVDNIVDNLIRATEAVGLNLATKTGIET